MIEQLRLYRINTKPTTPLVDTPPYTPPTPPTSNKNKLALAKAKVGTMSGEDAKTALAKICELGYDVVLD
ncbi:hypothetical protein, partial [Klebsiella pneumoniae]|uniref:hypothetical protein n=1 Tax=Klebsiella pneumoniae TaxID=573 RepID=UPI0025A30E72